MYVLHHISLNILLDVYVCKLDLVLKHTSSKPTVNKEYMNMTAPSQQEKARCVRIAQW